MFFWGGGGGKDQLSSFEVGNFYSDGEKVLKIFILGHFLEKKKSKNIGKIF